MRGSPGSTARSYRDWVRRRSGLRPVQRGPPTILGVVVGHGFCSCADARAPRRPFAGRRRSGSLRYASDPEEPQGRESASHGLHEFQEFSCVDYSL